MVAYYMFHKKNMLPSQFLKLDRLDKAAIIAFIQEKIRIEKEQEKEAERNKPKGKRR